MLRTNNKSESVLFLKLFCRLRFSQKLQIIIKRVSCLKCVNNIISHCAHNLKEKQRKSVIKWLLKATKSQKFCQKMPFFRHWLLHKLSKCNFSQNLSVRLFFSYLHPVLNVINKCFMQKTRE